MPIVNIVVDPKIPDGVRVKQVSGMFDANIQAYQRLQWSFDFPIRGLDIDRYTDGDARVSRTTHRNHSK